MPRPWIVLPHEPIEKLSDALWCAQGQVPGMSMKRRAMVARLGDGRLVFMNAIPLDEPSMKEIEAWGTPAFLIVPNPFHRIDLQPFVARYPSIEVLCGQGAEGAVGERVKVAGSWDRLPKDPRVEIVPVAGARHGEPWVLVRADGAADLCVPGDAMMNIPHGKGLSGLVMRLIGSSGGPKVTRIAKMVLIKDKAALQRQLVELAERKDLNRVVPCHGEIAQAAAALRTAAEGL